MILVMKSTRRKKNLDSLHRVRKVALIDLLLKDIKPVKKTKLSRQTYMEIFMITQTILKPKL